MVPDALLSSIELLDANPISDLDGKSFVFLGKNSGNASIADCSFTEYISKWNAFSYEPNTFFRIKGDCFFLHYSIIATFCLLYF